MVHSYMSMFNKQKKDKIKKKDSKRKKIITTSIVISVVPIIAWALVLVMGVAAVMFTMSGILGRGLFKSTEELVEQKDTKCKCGCLWVSGSDIADIEKGLSDGTTSGGAVTEGDASTSGSSIVTNVPSTGDLVNTAIPTYAGKYRVFVDAILPAAVVSEQYFKSGVPMVLGQITHEGGWPDEVKGYEDRIVNHKNNVAGIRSTKGFMTATGNGEHKHRGNGAFRNYRSISECVIDKARLFIASPRNYSVIIDAYESGWEAQVNAIASTPYLGGGKNTTAGELAQMRKDYSNKIVTIVNNQKFSELADLKTCFAYMEKNGLMDEYYKALEYIKQDYYGKHALKTPVEGVPEGASKPGHWVCNCEIPCKECRCHDSETPGSNVENGELPPIKGVDSGNFVQTPGIPQGRFNGKTIIELVNENKSWFNEPKNRAYALGRRGMAQYFGTSATIDSSNTERDSTKFKVPYYSQSNGVEKWDTTPYNFCFRLVPSGCYFYMHAYIVSALQQRLVNPPEMVVAISYFGGDTADGLAQPSGSNPMYKSFGYSMTCYTKGQVTADVFNKLDASLNSNIPCGMRATSANPTVAYGDSHYFVITEKVGDKYRLAQVSKSDRMRLWTKQELMNMMYRRGKEALFIVTKN